MPTTVDDLVREVEARAHTFTLEMKLAPDPEWAAEGFWTRFAAGFSEWWCGPLDEVPPEKLVETIVALGEFMPPGAPHGPELDALWESYLRYGTAVWDLLEAYAEVSDATPDSPVAESLRRGLAAIDS